MISVIIPAWNEEQTLARTVSSVRNSRALHEIIVVDGGSADNTSAVAMSLGVQTVSSRLRQRAAQMNLGAEHSKGEILLFLHADSVLPPAALDRIEAALEKQDFVGGGFARRFDSQSLFLKCTCLLAELRNRSIGWFLGDQAIFVRQPVFTRLGGFLVIDRFEDLDFSRRARRLGRLATLHPPVLTSARRFERGGPFRRTVRDFFLTMRYLQGNPRATDVPPKCAVKEHVC